MTSGTDTTSEALQRRLASTPDVLEHLEAAHRASRSAMDARLHELCRLRVAMLLGNALEEPSGVLAEAEVAELSRWPTSELFSATDRACLAFAEQFVIDVASIPDDMAGAVVEHLGADRFADFVNGLLVIEQRQRLRLVWDRLFEGGEDG